MSDPGPAKIGSHEVIREIGRGGMGVVYLARDTKLDREVAIKSMPEELAEDPDRLVRFEREARTLAQLSHPNVGGIYGVEEQEGQKYLILEYVEGETLADRLDRGPLTVEDTLEIAIEIAAGVETAHEAGIVHRDLKPDNIMITPEGRVKVLDFGLARTTGASSSSSRSDAVTAAWPTPRSPTEPGAILGTAPYMSPEQARGRKVDKRTDIWSFGCVLYEMLTGQRAFLGDSVPSTLAAIHGPGPDWERLPPETPAAIHRVTRKCLDKDPDHRLHDLADARIVIEDVLAGREWETTAHSETLHPPAGSSKLSWILAGLFALSALMFATMLVQRPEAPARAPIRFQVRPPEQSVFRSTGDGAAPVAVSPDGTMLVYGTFERSGLNRLWLRSLDTVDARPLPGTEGGIRPFWSPDNRFIGFFANGKLKKIEVTGGPPLPLCDVTDARGGAWSRDDVIVFAPGAAVGLSKVPAAGGTPEPVTELGENEGSHRYPFFFPGGRSFGYLALTSGGASASGAESDNQVFAASIDGGDPKRLLRGAANTRYLNGELIFYRAGQLVARPFDVGRLEFTGEARIVVEDVQYDAPYEAGLYSVSDGILAYHAGDYRGERIVQWIDRSGDIIETVEESAIESGPRISPDGRHVAHVVGGAAGEVDLWIEDLQQKRWTRVTFDSRWESTPVWSPDGRFLVYGVQNGRVFRIPVSGGDAQRILDLEQIEVNPIQWTRDGRHLILSVKEEGYRTHDVWAVALDPDGNADGEPFPLIRTPEYRELWPSVSPDGRWLAYTSNESGRWEVYVTSFPDATGKWQVSTGGGRESLWQGNGEILFFRSNANSFMEAEVAGDGAHFDVGAVHSLFDVFIPDELHPNYDVSSDGKRFLVSTITEEQARAPLTVVLGW